MRAIFLYTILYGAIPLVIVSILQIILEKALKISSFFSEEQRNEPGFGLYFLQFMSDLFFFVILPTLVYYWIYPILPFSGYRAGVAVGIAAYLLGSLPYAISLTLRIKIPAPVIMSTLFFNLLKLAAALGVITHYMSY